jgi:hypothetical protein
LAAIASAYHSASSAPYDLIIESPDDRLFRIQVKTGRLSNGVIRFAAVSSHFHRGRPAARYDGKIDAFAVYCPAKDSCYLIDVADICVRGNFGWLRVEPPRNNMERGIHWASNYLMRDKESPELFRSRLPMDDGAPDGD